MQSQKKVLKLVLLDKKSDINLQLLGFLRKKLPDVISAGYKFDIILENNSEKKYPILHGSRDYVGLTEISNAVENLITKTKKESFHVDDVFSHHMNILANKDDEEPDDTINTENLQKRIFEIEKIKGISSQNKEQRQENQTPEQPQPKEVKNEPVIRAPNRSDFNQTDIYQSYQMMNNLGKDDVLMMNMFANNEETPM